MTTETEEKLTPEQEDQIDKDAFGAGFESVMNAEPGAAEEPSRDDARKDSASADAGVKREPAGEQEELFAGLTAAQLKGLLAKAAKHDALEDQVQKAHGKIGEMNRTLHELMERQATAPAEPSADEVQSEKQLMDDYPDIAKLADIRARKVIEGILKEKPIPEAADTEKLAAEIEIRVQAQVQRDLMDYLHPDWEQTINGDDYKVWLATQPDEVKERATTTPRAIDLSGIVGAFKKSVHAVSGKAIRSKERLESALTPEGVRGGAAQVAAGDLDEFRAGFRSVRGG